MTSSPQPAAHSPGPGSGREGGEHESTHELTHETAAAVPEGPGNPSSGDSAEDVRPPTSPPAGDEVPRTAGSTAADPTAGAPATAGPDEQSWHRSGAAPAPSGAEVLQQAPQQQPQQTPQQAPLPAFPAAAPPPHPGPSGPPRPGAADPDEGHPHGRPPAPGADGYTSPLSMDRTHLGQALVSEWTKIRSVRSTLWTLGVMFVLTVGISSLVGWGLSTQERVELPVLSGGFFGLMLGQLCVVTLGVLVMTSEYSTGMVRSTFTACPRRTRVLTAKVLVFFTVSFTTTLAATALAAAVQAALLEGMPVFQTSQDTGLFPEGAVVDGRAFATGGEWLGATVGAALYVALLGLLSLAVGTLLRSSPGAITVMIGLVLVPFLVSLFLWAESVRTVGEKLREFSVLNGLSSLYRLPMVGNVAEGGSGWSLLWLLAAVTGAALIGAYVRIAFRDV